jgi:hypothetical protein
MTIFFKYHLASNTSQFQRKQDMTNRTVEIFGTELVWLVGMEFTKWPPDYYFEKNSLDQSSLFWTFVMSSY